MALSSLRWITGRKGRDWPRGFNVPVESHAPANAADLDNINAQAILWHVRLRDAVPTDREAFSTWLDRDPRHARAFASIRSEGSPIDADNPDMGHASDDRQHHYGRWGVGGVVAMTIAAFFVWANPRSSDPYEIVTQPGSRRVITLAGDTRVTLNGDTRIRLDRHDARVATLMAGEALFEVRHDPARPFRLSVAGRQIEDVGTIFNVAAYAKEVRVAVAEGSVLYNPTGERIALNAGQALVDTDGRATIGRIEVAPATIGGWRRGQLVYSGEPLAQVATDLSRALGTVIVASPVIAERPFSGAITLHERAGKGHVEQELTRLAPAMNLVIERTSHGWMMKPGSGAAR